MSESKRLPVIVIAGRPNVGKSTLFNTIAGKRRAIVGDEPGITRDRIRARAEHRGRPFELVDTGGIVPGDDQLIPAEILKQARFAFDSADHIVYVIDGRTEITGADRDLARLLRQTGKPVSLAVNKIDAPAREPLAADFYSLGFEHLFPVSAEHRIGIEELLDHATEGFAAGDEPVEERPRIRVAIIGRPNVGKSTLLNALVGAERSIVAPEAGTTRDAVDETVTHEDAEFVFVDTAGIRRKGKTKLMAEKLSVVIARKHIESADVALVLIDPVEGPVALDATIAGYAHEAGRPVIVCVNKWDIAPDKDKKAMVQAVRDAMKFLDYAPVAFLSAARGMGVKQLFGLIRRSYGSWKRRISTADLNRFFEKMETDRNTRVRYVTQVSTRPPAFVVFKDGARPLHFSMERFIANQIRQKFGFEGTPIVIKTRSKNRP